MQNSKLQQLKLDLKFNTSKMKYMKVRRQYEAN